MAVIPWEKTKKSLPLSEAKTRKAFVSYRKSFPACKKVGKAQDRWGTPWRFHALSGQHMEVLSAGPDRSFGTDDDLGW